MHDTLAIIGPGTLGRALASWASLRGLLVRLAGRDLDHSREGLRAIEAGWERGLAKGSLDQEAVSRALKGLRACGTWDEALEGAGTVLEALPESLPCKIGAWALLDRACGQALRLTGSSSLPLRAIRAGAGMQGRLLGFHLFLPLERMDVVELVSEHGTPPALLERAGALAGSLDRGVVPVRDGAGYVASRMALAQGLEAMRLLESGAADAEGLDALMVRGYGHPMGPLELSDRIGLDLRLAIARGIFEATGDPSFQPPAILESLVARGCLGVKSGRGFHTWPRPGGRP